MARKDDRSAVDEVLRRLLEDMPALSRAITREIRATVHEYDLVPLGDHADHVQEQQVRILQALLDDRPLGEEDLARAAALGRQRATQGVSVEGVISAYHVGNRELWKLIDERTTKGRDVLPTLATFMWDSIHQTTTEIVAAHSSAARARHTQDLTSRHRLVELLGRDELDVEAEEVAVRLGFDIDQNFLAVYVSAGERPVEVAHALHEELEYVDGVTFAVPQGADLVVLAQRVDPAALRTVIDALGGSVRAGFGLARPGLDGARLSLVDAWECLLSTDDLHRTRDYVDDWWIAGVVAQADRLEQALGDRWDVVGSNPHLVETIQVFADSGFSVSETARRLHVHANSVAYRLDRWHQLTGWDPRSFSGLAHSMSAHALVQVRTRFNNTGT